MRFFQSFLLSLGLFAVILFSSPTIVHAQLDKAMQNLNSAVGVDAKVKTGLSGDLAGTVGTVVKGILGLTGTIFLLLTVYAGILWMTAQGSEEQIKKATDIIKACTIGLIITLSAYSITYFVTNRVSKSAAPASSTVAK